MNKKLINIFLNIIFIGVLFYFADINTIIDSLKNIKIIFLLLGIIFSLFYIFCSSMRWFFLTKLHNPKLKVNKTSFIIASYKKEFFSSYTSNIVGDIYSIFKVEGISKKDLTYTLILTKIFDLLIVSLLCIPPLVFFGYLNYTIAIVIAILLLLVIIFIDSLLALLMKFSLKIKFLSVKTKDAIHSLSQNKSTYKTKLFLIISTIFIWGIRMLTVFFTFSSLSVKMNLLVLLFLTFVPIISSIIIFILPKSISGDSFTIIIGLSAGLEYNILTAYVVLHRIYSVIIALVGLVYDSLFSVSKI